MPPVSLLGPQHEQAARQMAVRALLGCIATLVVLSMLCAPLLLVLPVGLVVYAGAEAAFAVLYW